MVGVCGAGWGDDLIVLRAGGAGTAGIAGTAGTAGAGCVGLGGMAVLAYLTKPAHQALKVSKGTMPRVFCSSLVMLRVTGTDDDNEVAALTVTLPSHISLSTCSRSKLLSSSFCARRRSSLSDTFSYAFFGLKSVRHSLHLRPPLTLKE